MLRRTDLDGSDPVTILTGYSNIYGLALFPASAYAEYRMIDQESFWRYLDDGSNQGTAWRGASFDDSAWRLGVAELGYGDAANGRPERTTILSGPAENRHVTYYFRREFSLADPSQIASLQLDLKRDDGAVVYINGAEVLRDNMPSGTITSSTLALAAVADDGADFVPFSLPTGSLAPGRNVIAVEIHQATRSGSDVSFDLRLRASPRANPIYGVFANDEEPERDAWSAVLVSQPLHGNLVFRTDGTFTYTPSPGFVGVDQFVYRAEDGAATTAPTLVTLNVGAANAAPLATDDRYVAWGNLLTVESEVGLLANDFDANGDALSTTVLAPPARGTLLLADDGSFIYAPEIGFVGEDTFTYRATDGNTFSAAATVTLNIAAAAVPAAGLAVGAEPGTTSTASTAPSSTSGGNESSIGQGSTTTLPIFADLNGDGRVDRGDLAGIVAVYASPIVLADLDGDGRIGVRDAIALRNAFTPLPAPAAVVARANDRAIVSSFKDLDVLRTNRRTRRPSNEESRIAV